MLTDGRLGSSPRPSLAEHVHAVQLATEQEAIEEFIDMDLAHVVMLYECDILNREVAAELLRPLLEISDPAGRVALVIDPSRGSMLLQIEAFLAKRCGSVGGMLQVARSRIDQSAEAMRLVARRSVVSVIAAMLELGRAYLDAAVRFDAQPAPGYTHFQHSQPTTLGHYFNAHYWATSRDLSRLRQALMRIDLCALGGVALSGTSWPIDRRRTAALLGHDGIVANARDAGVFSLDVLGEVAATLALAANALGRMAGDLLFWSASEVGYLRLDSGLCGTSSMMPQKRNPYALERIRAVAGESIGWPAAQLGLLKLATSTDGDILFSRDRTPEICNAVVGSAALMRDCIATLVVDAARLRNSAAAHWSTASALADELVRVSGCSFREAHDVVARLVRRSEEQLIAFDDLGIDDLRGAVRESGHGLNVDTLDIRRTLDLEKFIATRISVGGIGDKARKELAELAEDDLATHVRDHMKTLDRLSRARDELFARARQIAGLESPQANLS